MERYSVRQHAAFQSCRCRKNGSVLAETKPDERNTCPTGGV
nr:MAG TPA: hypothetical protein [Caudoviricetes sp.]